MVDGMDVNVDRIRLGYRSTPLMKHSSWGGDGESGCGRGGDDGDGDGDSGCDCGGANSASDEDEGSNLMCLLVGFSRCLMMGTGNAFGLLQSSSS